jgi:NAD(P)-dependent dehydrogenase (short-subunit alcohol dehydrogenase family)
MSDMRGRICVVTGATQGIGRVTARELARMGATVTIVARNAERGQAVLDEIRRDVGVGDRAGLVLADLSIMAEVRRAAAELRERHPRLHVLVNNAGAIHMTRKVTAEGLETTFATNHLSYFLLTKLLLPALEGGAASGRKARVVSVASAAHLRARLDLEDLQVKRGYTAYTAYANSKLANILFTYELARRLEGKPITANCLHPGVIATGFGRNDPGFFNFLVRLARPFLASPEKGARTTIYLASSPEIEGVSGKYFDRSRPIRSRRASYDRTLQRRLWEISESLTRPDTRTA